MCAIKPEPSVYSEHSLDTLSRTGVFVFWLFLTLKLFLETGGGEKAVSAAAAAMVFCVGCGNQLLGRYCRQCGAEDSQWTAHAQSQVPVLKQSKSRKGGKSAASAALKSNGSAAGVVEPVHKPELELSQEYFPDASLSTFPGASLSTAFPGASLSTAEQWCKQCALAVQAVCAAVQAVRA